jgi:hypothetical protein
VAVLRHRLYEIDRILSRTVSYALLSAGARGHLRRGNLLLAPLVGGGSELAVAASTLAAAAAFQPLRRRLQTVVDRRFNRARYDARKAVEAFGAALRSETDLHHVAEELMDVVRVTVAPSSASLWLRAKVEAGVSGPTSRRA